MSTLAVGRINRVQRTSWIVGAAALAICAAVGAFDGTRFFRAYLLAFLFWSGIPLGALVVLMMHHLVGGGWGFLIRRPLEAATRTLPIVALFVVPVLLGIHSLYTWSSPAAVAADRLLQHKQVYLNTWFFVIRTAAYFAIWIGLAHFLNRWPEEQDRTGSPAFSRRLYAMSGPGIIVFAITMSLASLDWVMSLEPDWFSTIYAAVFMMGQVLSALTFAIVVLRSVIDTEPLAEVAAPRYLVDLGNLLLAFVMLWTYMAFSQFLIIWSGNLTDEIGWYLRRMRHGWQWIAVLIFAGHFAVPFLLLLGRGIKRNIGTLGALAGALFLMRIVDMWWNVDPAFSPDALRFPWMNALAIVGLGGLWIASFLSQLTRRPLLPLHDPELPEILAGAAEPLP